MRVEAIEELKLTGRLPSPPGVGMAILELTSGDDFVIGDVARVIQSDPALTGRLLKLTNSSRNATIRPITTVEDAVNRLGMSTLRAVALGFSLVSNYREGACQAFDFTAFWSESLARALAAQQVASALEIGNPAEAYCCGLLAKIGKLGLACVHPALYAEVLGENKEADLLGAEFAAFAVNHADLGEALLLDWGLPAFLSRVVAVNGNHARLANETKSTTELVHLLQIAEPIARLCVVGEDRSESDVVKLEAAQSQSEMNEDNFQKLCKDVSESWREWVGILDLSTNKVPSSDLAEDADPNPITVGEDESLDSEDASRSRTLRVLVIDEDPISVGILSKSIADSEHEVMSCRQGGKALATVLDFLPDIVICNAELTDTTGLELVRTLRGCPEGRQVYIMLLSARDDPNIELDAYRVGVDDFMLKPFDPLLVRAHLDAGARLVAMKRQIQNSRQELEAQVAEMAILNRRLMKASLTDPLTGLPNRRSAMETLKTEWAEAAQIKDARVALMIIDIDHFKLVNDSFGHDVGDEVLKRTAVVFDSGARLEEKVARIGGEEFLVVCAHGSSDHAEECAERLRVAVEENHIVFGGFDSHVTVSIGVAFGNPHVEGYEAVLKTADEALYTAKKSGRNQVHVLHPGALV